MRLYLAALLAVLLTGCAMGQRVQSVRLYVFDCGTLHIGDPSRFRLAKEEVTTPDLAMACVLIAHPKGTLMWDTGGVPDADWRVTGAPVSHRVLLPDGQERQTTLRKPLLAQIREAGFDPGRITYLALSHYHWDHTGNANAFSDAKWLVRKPDYDVMFGERPAFATQPSTYSALRGRHAALITTDNFDVFGDESVVLKAAPGHTPGHQVLYVRLAKTGPVILSGDLYHYEQSRTLQRIPTFDLEPERSRASRAAIEEYLKWSGAELWIQHDFAANAKLKKAPAYYD